MFPIGDASFADAVVSVNVGKPSAAAKSSNAKAALGPPDYSESDPQADGNYISLGCGGTAVFQFTDNSLINVEGPDLYVFEIGPAVEATNLAISADGRRWIEVGRISGGTAAVDIAGSARNNERYRYVRVTDAKSDCSGDWPGADIDAIGAIGAALALTVASSVLFDTNQATLKLTARQALQTAADQLARYPDSQIVVEGHTDNVGTADYNLKLSIARAEAVRAYLQSDPRLKGRAIGAAGLGAARPIASNETEDGRQQNRRVDIIVTVKRR